jgi:hypothetical protein
MKITLIIITLLSIALLLAFCKSNQAKYNATTLPTAQVRWGSGGGITGKETAKTTTELPMTKAKTAHALFETAKNLGLADIAFDQPGNMYYFLEIKDGETAKRITWGDNANPVEQKVKDFYTVLNQLLTSK